MKTQKRFSSNRNNEFNSSSKTSIMERLVRTGLSAIAAFALMMTVTLTAGATEKAVETAKEKAATETVGLAASVEAQTLSVTVEKLIAKWAMEKAVRRPEKPEVMVEPVDDEPMAGLTESLALTKTVAATKRIKSFNTPWYFHGESMLDLRDHTQWRQDPVTGCETETQLDLPCEFIPTIEITLDTDLIDYFDLNYPSDDAGLVAAAESWKEEQ